MRNSCYWSKGLSCRLVLAGRRPFLAAVMMLWAVGIAAAPAAHPAQLAECMPAPSAPHEMPLSESEPASRSHERSAATRRGMRRVLGMLGLSRRKHLVRVLAENARLNGELQRARQLLAEATEPPTAQQTIVQLRSYLLRAKSEIDYRTRLWHRAAAGQQVTPDRFGFQSLHLTPPDPRPAGPYFEKNYRDRLEISGLEADRACWLELSCLLRLQSAADGLGAPFPTPVALDPAAPRLTMTHQGWSLDGVPRDRKADIAAKMRPEIARIAARIAAALERARVVHLDMHLSGRHLTVDASGRVSLIDFDIAALDGFAISATIARRLRQFHENGGYATKEKLIAEQLTRFCDDADRLGPVAKV